MKLTEDQRQKLGEALTTKLAAMCPEGTRGPVAPDWFDSRNVDEVLDVIEQTLTVGVTGAFLCRKPAIGPACETQCERCAADAAGVKGKTK